MMAVGTSWRPMIRTPRSPQFLYDRHPRTGSGARARHVRFARPVPDKKLYPKTALALLTTLNLLNYIDRNVLYAVQDLVKAEFHRSDAAFGFLTSVFFIFY